MQRGDAVAAGFVAHRLEWGARSLGAFALGARCERIETLAQDGPGDALDAELRCFETDLVRLLARLAGGGPAALPQSRAASAEQASVLLLDDDAQQLKLLQRQLAQLVVGPVHGCSDGAAALQWLRGRDSSRMLLMLDLNMPGMDGVEFMRHLAQIEYAGALVLVSGSDARVLDSAGRLAQVHKLAVLDRLHKPVDNAKLQALVERWRAFRPRPIGAAVKVYDTAALEAAISGGQLLLHYQPKVSLRDGAWVGVEALVRWQHPSDGLQFPDRFVALAEASGQIDALTRRVIELALAQARRWRDAGHELRMAVNVSMDNLTRLDFPDFVVDEAARHGVPTTDLVLEVTESRLMGDARAPLDNLTRLRLKRIRLSIDDFGTGHSSLAQLRDMPFDELKIDRGFVHDSHRDATLRAILVASLEMAHQLGMPVVAEGVEDRADWDFVRSAGCDVAQGYFIGKPLPAEALDEWPRAGGTGWSSCDPCGRGPRAGRVRPAQRCRTGAAPAERPSADLHLPRPAAPPRGLRARVPQVLVLAFKSLSDAELYHLGLYRHSKVLNTAPHRVLLLCTKADAQRAYELCRRDYSTTTCCSGRWPTTPRLPMSVHAALRELHAAGAAAPLAQLSAQARRIAELEQQLEQQITIGTAHAERAQAQVERARLQVGEALDGLAGRLLDGAGPVTHDAPRLHSEVARARARRRRRDRAAAALQPVQRWIGTLKSELDRPLQAARRPAEAGPAAGAGAAGADDDPFLRKTLQHVLGSVGYTVQCADSGAEALRLVGRRRPS